MRLSSQSTVNNYAAVMEDESRANEAKSAVESELQRLLGSDNGYYVYSASEWLEEMNKMINMVIVILTGIASISLLVGGIGIMNIMLVSVTERTREIGIRKALGAKERTILSQFVVEAATTSALGGALGIALGYIVSMGANKVLPMFTSGTTVTVSPSFNSIAVAFGISVGIGVLFGYLPQSAQRGSTPLKHCAMTELFSAGVAPDCKTPRKGNIPMKKTSFRMSACSMLAVSVLVLPASAASLNNSAIQTAITLGAMDTSQTGSLDAAVTRGAFAKMLVSFSAYRESASQQGNLGTLYKDVPGSSQWAPYVRIAVQQGWINGYTDGTFRPDNTVTLEEACTAALKLLGYKMTDLNGVFPTAQLNKAQELGLRNQLNRSQSEAMNYEDCALLLYNTLTANTASGSAYGTSLGFTVSNGQVGHLHGNAQEPEGPFVAAEGTQLPFTPVSIYRNDKVSASAELNRYDVYYYSESLQTVWIYTRKAAGRITAVSPSAAHHGRYRGGHQLSAGQHSSGFQGVHLNGGGVGEVVTLLLGMNNEAADVITGAEADEVFYGVVQGAARSLVEDNGADVLQRVAVMCTDGVQRTVNVDKSLNYPKGWLVEIRVTPEASP